MLICPKKLGKSALDKFPPEIRFAFAKRICGGSFKEGDMNFMLFGGMMCPIMTKFDATDAMWDLGLRTFLIVWFVIVVPVIITARLDKIVKLLQDKK